MEIWQFWLGIGIIFALLGVIVAILIKKHRDRHKIAGLQKNIEDLEKSFKYLQEDIEEVTERNLSTMEKQCERMSELLLLADKRCISATDLLKDIEQETQILRELNVSGGNNILNLSSEKQKIMESVEAKLTPIVGELKEDINSINKHLNFLNNRVTALENKTLDDSSEKKDTNNDSTKELKSEIVELKRRLKNVESLISEKVTEEIAKQLNFLDTGFAEVANEAIDIDKTNKKDNTSDVSNDISDEDLSNKLKALYDDKEQEKTANEKNDEISFDETKSDYYSNGRELVVKEIMDSYNQGLSIRQISENLKMSRGEVEMIIKFNDKVNLNKEKENHVN